MQLRPYKNCDAEIITAWVKSEYAFRQWSADRYKSYPITAEDMNLYYNREKSNYKIWVMTAVDKKDIVGHFTLRYTDENTKVIRLGFVIIDDKKRKKGYGKEMVDLAVKYAFDTIKANKITLGVFENNSNAIKCYKSCGFEEIKVENIENYVCMGEVWNCIEMERKKGI